MHRPAARPLRAGVLGGSRPPAGGLAQGARGDGGYAGWDARGAAVTAGELPRFRLGEDIVHAAFGDGVVTGVEPGGVIVVRFAGDGSERKLMADYAPLSRR